MAVEAGTTISNLDSSWPRSDDSVSEGDNHLRIIKSILQSQFPGAAGDGYAKVIDATEDELNYSQGLSGNIQDQLDALGVRIDDATEDLDAPLNTILIFYSQYVPPGWEVYHYGNDYMLRVIDPDIHTDAPGGFNSPISFSGAHTHATTGHTLTIEEMPKHSHEYGPFTIDDQLGLDHVEIGSGAITQFSGTSNTGGDASHNHGATKSGGVDWAPRYLACVSARKV